MKIIYEQLRAFVSSRMEELSLERRTVKDALDEMRVLAWVYEDDAGAQPRSPEESYREELKKSDLFISNLYMEGLQYRETQTGVGIEALFEIRRFLAGENPSSIGLRELVEKWVQDETRDRLLIHTERIRETIHDIGAGLN